MRLEKNSRINLILIIRNPFCKIIKYLTNVSITLIQQENTCKTYLLCKDTLLNINVRFQQLNDFLRVNLM